MAKKAQAKTKAPKKATAAEKPNSKKSTQDKLTGQAAGAPFNDQDVKRRLGNFESAGEHARKGGRTAGIVGQTKQRSRTDKRTKSK